MSSFQVILKIIPRHTISNADSDEQEIKDQKIALVSFGLSTVDIQADDDGCEGGRIFGPATSSISYREISAIEWDFIEASVRIDVSNDDGNSIIFSVKNLEDFEREFMHHMSESDPPDGKFPLPKISFVGLFIGGTRPKPFTRMRADLTASSANKLPPLNFLHQSVLDLHHSMHLIGDQSSRRVSMATNHIQQGFVQFSLNSFCGPYIPSIMWHPGSVILLSASTVTYKPVGHESIDYPYSSLSDWLIVGASSSDRQDGKGGRLQLRFKNGNVIYLGVEHLCDLQHSLEFFWNRFRFSHGLPPKPGSTHGRRVMRVRTLTGDAPAVHVPPGNRQVRDSLGNSLLYGTSHKKKPSSGIQSLASWMGLTSMPTVQLQENPTVRPHWDGIVLAQGWLGLQQQPSGGWHIFPATWHRRFFVLYSTCQGHFLLSYDDVSDCPLCCSEDRHNGAIDLAKTAFIRPHMHSDTDFDVLTIDGGWSLRADDRQQKLLWLQRIAQGADEDAVVMPDDEVSFRVKAKGDVSGTLDPSDYSTTLGVSALGMTVYRTHEEFDKTSGKKTRIEKECFFWPYTNFYKWSEQSVNGKPTVRLEVYMDCTFSKKVLFLFRLKNPEHLVTAIELYMEKFMTLMRLRLELNEKVPSRDAQGTEWAQEQLYVEISSPMPQF